MDKNSELSRDKNYQYGIFAKIKGRSWNERQVKMYMDKNDILYKKEDKMEHLIERLKSHEDKKYAI